MNQDSQFLIFRNKHSTNRRTSMPHVPPFPASLQSKSASGKMLYGLTSPSLGPSRIVYLTRLKHSRGGGVATVRIMLKRWSIVKPV